MTVESAADSAPVTRLAEEGRSATSGPALSPVGARSPRDSIGWLRAIGSGVVILLVAFIGVIVGPNLILTSSISMARDTRVLLATGLALSFTCLLAWALRRLQTRGLI